MLKRCNCGGFCRVQGELRPVGALQKNGQRKKEMVYTHDICNYCNAAHPRRIAKVYDAPAIEIVDPAGRIAREGMTTTWQTYGGRYVLCVLFDGMEIGYATSYFDAEKLVREHVTELMLTNEIPSLAWQAEEARQARLADEGLATVRAWRTIDVTAIETELEVA